ncbi:SPARC-related modular calcium-binding protein 2-like [Bufo gargarizans]|uniref:SPARC-related modular calcium-binding protein 2-like n=1 Tax=Bufo gargarizans TaxID=30331 RepID=UPI001CF311E7|nr:SPARC-related modular calcium-binding protein 2-like [Bufo gargarizans]
MRRRMLPSNFIVLAIVFVGPLAGAQKFSALTFLRVDQDKDKECNLDCAGSPSKLLCASDGRTFLSRCEFQRAKCKDSQLEIAYRGNCKDVSRCVAERKYTQEQARKEFQQVFIPECNDDGTYSEVQCHSYTGYCWCVSPNGRPLSGTAVVHKTPRCPGSLTEKVSQREGTGKADDVSVVLETQPQGDEEDFASRYPTLWTEQVKSRQNRTHRNSGCPGAKKNEFLTSVLDALTTDMVHAVSDLTSSSSRVSEPDPNHTLEERVVHWYFKQLDKNSSGDIGKKEIKPFKRLLRKKSKPKKCVKKFVEYCDVNNDKSLSVHELMGCLGVTKDEGTTPKSIGENPSSYKQISRKQG